MRSVDLCPPPHLCAADLSGDTVVTIKGFDIKEVGADKEIKGVIYFEEFTRGLVVNKTNRERIEGLHGKVDDVTEWIGKKITLYASETEYGGQTVDCIRVRPKK